MFQHTTYVLHQCPPQANDTIVLWFIEFEGLERGREKECVCNVHMISTKSFLMPTFVCFTTMAILGIPSHYIFNPSSIYEVSCAWPYRKAWTTSTIAYARIALHHFERLIAQITSRYYYHRIYYGEGDSEWWESETT